MARKSKEFQKLFQEERMGGSRKRLGGSAADVRKEELKAYEDFKKRLRRNQDNEDLVFVEKPEKGMKKMSEVLIDFVEPLINDQKSYEKRNFLMKISVVAWNMSLLDEEKREEMMQDLLNLLFPDPLEPNYAEGSQEIRIILQQLIDRKLKLFAEDNRFVTDYQLSKTKGGFHLSAAYSPVVLPKD